MNQDPSKRKLTAILSADVVGYSRLMEADESWTIQSLEENKKLMSSFIEELHGRVVDSPGDNLLAEFSSVINAVECAVKIQKELNRKNSKLMEDHRMLFRIGVNLGDVVEEDGKLYGNGVNIAARLEGLAEPGGICISGTAYDHLKGKVDVDYDYLGEYEVKNINEPVRVYRILMGGSTEKYVPHGKSQNLINPLSKGIAVIILLLITGIAVWNLKPVKPCKIAHLEFNLPEDHKILNYPVSILAVSPDGSSFVYCTDDGLYRRPLAELNAKLIPGTEGHLNVDPFFSSDGNWIGYYSYDDQMLKKIPIAGGIPSTLCNTPLGIDGVDWLEDDTIIYSNSIGDIMRISANGGDSKCIVGMEDPAYLTSPQILPGGEFLLYTAKPAGVEPKIMLYSFKSKESKELFTGNYARYLLTGHIIYVMGNVLYARPFDLKRLEPTGESFSVIEDILVVDGTPRYDVSDSGTLIYIPEQLDQMTIPVWVDKSGKEESINIYSRDYLFPNISPDGTKVSFTVVEGREIWDIWILDLIQNSPRRLTFKTNGALSLWGQDSNEIVYSDRGGIYRRAADGRGEVETLIHLTDTSRIHPWSWSKDGKTLVLGDDTGTGDIRILSMEGDREMKPLLTEKYAERRPQVSPDGRWIVYEANEEDSFEIFVRPFPDVNDGHWQVSSEGGHNPLWSQDGSELFYRNGYAVMAVSVKSDKSGTAFKFESPEILFQKYFVGGPTGAGTFWDIHPDGRFLMFKEPPVSRINIFLDWFEELKKKVPVE